VQCEEDFEKKYKTHRFCSRKCSNKYQSEKYANQRKKYQNLGRQEANGDPLHIAGCMLYWAEGSKSKNVVGFCNSEVNYHLTEDQVASEE
jgi:hypothetical protein